MIKKISVFCLVLTIFCATLLFSYDSGKNQPDTLETKCFYYKNGALKKKVEMKNNIYHGKMTTWYKNGKKEMEAEFKNGVLNGKTEVWYANGNLMISGEFKNGEHHGKLRELTEAGTESCVTVFENGKLCSTVHNTQDVNWELILKI